MDGARIDSVASGLSDYATSGERADASVRCTELAANLCAADALRHGPVFIHVLAEVRSDWISHSGLRDDSNQAEAPLHFLVLSLVPAIV